MVDEVDSPKRFMSMQARDVLKVSSIKQVVMVNKVIRVVKKSTAKKSTKFCVEEEQKCFFKSSDSVSGYNSDNNYHVEQKDSVDN
jgi:hypothetical protein